MSDLFYNIYVELIFILRAASSKNFNYSADESEELVRVKLKREIYGMKFQQSIRSQALSYIAID